MHVAPVRLARADLETVALLQKRLGQPGDLDAPCVALSASGAEDGGWTNNRRLDRPVAPVAVLRRGGAGARGQHDFVARPVRRVVRQRGQFGDVRYVVVDLVRGLAVGAALDVRVAEDSGAAGVDPVLCGRRRVGGEAGGYCFGEGDVVGVCEVWTA